MQIISQAPTRISLLGGGTDVGEYSSKYGGICINLAINIRQHIDLDFETEECHTIIPQNANLRFYEKIFDEFDLTIPCRFIAKFDTFIESGLGSSASATVALVGAINKFKKLRMSKDEIAEKAWDIEVNKQNIFGGKQDQYAAAHGGANMLIFEDRVYRYALNRDRIEKIIPHLALFYLGINRKSSLIQEGLRKIDSSQKHALDKIKDLAYDGLDMINQTDILGLGAVLDETWEFKKKSNKGISNEYIGRIYEKARKNGAIGGKVLGAGGGGHILFITNDKEKLKSALQLKHVDFDIDWEGLKVK